MSAPAPSRRWLFGPWPDLMLGCGLAYFVIFGVLALAGQGLRLHPALAPVLALLFGAPHYGATLLRVYEQRADRRSYVLFSVWATLLVIAAFVAGVYDRTVAIALFTLYITWSPWHYSGQNYGIAVMFLRRRGVSLDPLSKRLLYGSFVTSFLVTFLAVHGTHNPLSYNPNAVPYESADLALYSIGIPYAATRVLFIATLAGYLACLLGASVRLRRSAPWRDLFPTAALVVTQALWFAVPFSVSFLGLRTGIAPFDQLELYVLWTALAHSIQYLWVTSYYARASSGWSSHSNYLLKAIAAGTAAWTLPVVLFAPDRSGGPEFVAGLGLLAAAAVNIHHFILDGAIWKLRNSRIASVLIRAGRDERGVEPQGISRLGRATWALCGLGLVIAIAQTWWGAHAFPDRLKLRDLAGAERVLDRMAWTGYDNSRYRLLLASEWMVSGETGRARQQVERSLELRPTAAAWTALAGIDAGAEDWAGVLGSFERAQALGQPTSQLGEMAARAWYMQGERARAREILHETSLLEPGSASLHARLGRVARDLQDWGPAADYYREALRLQPERRNVANDLAWVLATADDDSVRDPEAAIRWAHEALRGQDPPDPNFLDTLSVAYEAAGRIEEARFTARQATDLARAQGNEALSRQLDTRIALLGDAEAREADPAPRTP